MNNQTSNINRLIDTVGTETFIKYFHEFATLNRDEVIKLFEDNNETWNDNGKKIKASIGKRIFEENLELEALEHIILKKKENNIPNGSWVKKRAKEIYKDYNPTSEMQSEETKLSRTEKKILVKYRLLQGKYRRKLLLYWEGCSITECKISALLIASHIKSYLEASDEEKYDTNNGLLLTPTYDKLFDRHLISFNNDGKIILSKTLEQTDLTSLKITGNENIQLNKLTPSIQKYLEYHRQKFEDREKNSG